MKKIIFLFSTLLFSILAFGQKGFYTDPNLPAHAPRKIALHEMHDPAVFKTEMQKSCEQGNIKELPEDGYFFAMQGHYKSHSSHKTQKVGFAVWFRDIKYVQIRLDPLAA